MKWYAGTGGGMKTLRSQWDSRPSIYSRELPKYSFSTLEIDTNSLNI